MNGGMTECSSCDCDPCQCARIGTVKERKRITDGKVVVKTAIDVFSRVGRIRMKLIKLLWPEIKELSNDLYDYQNKS